MSDATAGYHPQFDAEQDRLNLTLKHIRNSLHADVPQGGADELADRALVRLQAEERAILRHAERQAYVARIDMQESGDCATYYIGRHLVNNTRETREAIVYSWAAPQIGDWLYLGSPNRLLKRSFDIRRDTLLTIHDEFVHPRLLERQRPTVVDTVDSAGAGAGSEVSAVGRFTDSALHRLLSQSREGRLYDIVATIQEQQYRIIKSPADRLLVIQGSAGSGKSSIALHRMAYLLHNHRERFKRIVVLGPNRMFMEYTSHILPALGERNVLQKTVDDLLLEIIGTAMTYHSLDEAMETLLSNTVNDSVKQVQYRTGRLKGSLTMATMLEKYVERLATPPKLTTPAFTVSVYWASPENASQHHTVAARRTAAHIQQLLDEQRALPLYRRWEEVEKHLILDIGRELVASLRQKMTQGGTSARDDMEAVESAIGREVKGKVRGYLNGWRKVSAAALYRRLLGSQAELESAGKGTMKKADIDLLVRSAPGEGRRFHFSDLPAIAYLTILLQGSDSVGGSNMYDHIVVDEAQDLSPMHFKVLSRLMRTPSMTVLGDLAQGIYAHAGIGSWEELAQLTGQQVDRQSIVESYRSTHQITDFANALLTRAVGDTVSPAIPISRDGPLPTFNDALTLKELAVTVARLTDQEVKRGNQSIAILCKTAIACAALDRQLAGISTVGYHLLTDRDATLDAGVVIMPAYLAKGLEFDAVIVADADSRTYRADKRYVDGKLLYVAVTRATHALHLCWVGKPTPLLGVV